MASIINAATSGGLVTSADTSGILQLQTASTTAVTVDASQNVGIGTSSPAYKLDVAGTNYVLRLASTSGTSRIAGFLSNTSGLMSWGLESSAGGSLFTGAGAYEGCIGTDVAKNFNIGTSGTVRAVFDTSGNVGIGTSPINNGGYGGLSLNGTNGALFSLMTNGTESSRIASVGNETSIQSKATTGYITFVQGVSGGTERARISSSGELLVGKTVNTFSTGGIVLNVDGNKYSTFTRNGGGLADFNRTGDDGNLIAFWQDGTQEGNIVVTGTTVSYNGGHLSRYAQTITPKDDSIVKGTVLSNLDEMSVYTKDGQPVSNEQLNKVKVSDTEGDVNVAGVFVSWSHDEEHNVDEINMAMTGDMIIRIAQGVTVVRGDLLMSAGDGTAKPQGDDIVRSKTVAKVTSNHITCTYADGSYCVPCVLMAC